MRWLILLALLTITPIASAPAQQAAGQPVAGARTQVTLNISQTATRRYVSILQAIEQQEWVTVRTALEELQRRHVGELVQVRERLGIDGALLAKSLRLRLPDDVLSPWGLSVDGLAAQQLAEALQADDLQGLGQVLYEYPASKSAAQAATAIIELEARTGHLDRATAVLNLLASSESRAVFEPGLQWRIRAEPATAALLEARRILLTSLSADPLDARRRLASFIEAHPEASGQLAGRHGRLHDILEHELRLLENLHDGAPWVRPPPAAHNRVIAGRISTGVPLWTVPHSKPLPVTQLTQTPPLSRNNPPTSLPAIWGDGVFLQDLHSIRALSLTDGTPLWATQDDAGTATIFRDRPNEQTVPVRPSLGDIVLRPAVEDGQLVARLGWPFSVQAAREPRLLDSRLVCLDVDQQQGKLLWSVHESEALPAEGQWRWSGPPLLAGGLVFIAARKSRPSMEVGMQCLDAATGQPVWFTTVCGLLEEPPSGYHLATSDLPTVANGRVYLAGDFGATAALESRTGRLEWVAADPPRPWTPGTSFPDSERPLRPAVSCSGVLYSVASDDRTITARDALTGELLWSRPVPDTIAGIIGCRAGMVLIGGRRAWALDRTTGDIHWKFGSTHAAAAGTGGALLTSERLFWPVRNGLFEIDLGTGTAMSFVPLHGGYGLQGGALTTAGKRLLITAPDHISCWVLRPRPLETATP